MTKEKGELRSMVRALRGAITAEKNEREEILSAAAELVGELMRANSISAEDMIDIIFTVTGDLTSQPPAPEEDRWIFRCRKAVNS